MGGPTGSWSGIVVPPGELDPGGCVEVEVDGERVAFGRAAWNGSLALRFRAPVDLENHPIELSFSDGFREVHGAPRSEGLIAFVPSSTPLAVEEPGTITFRGWLSSVPHSTPIEEGWMANWTSRRVTPIPRPTLDSPFTVRFDGSPGDGVAPVSAHASGGAGGCFWPRGGGGIARCTREGYESGACVYVPPGPACTGGRGCTPLPATERESGLGGPRQPVEIPIAPPYVPEMPSPLDGGVADGEPS
jgi:hypothetical protein